MAIRSVVVTIAKKKQARYSCNACFLTNDIHNLQSSLPSTTTSASPSIPSASTEISRASFINRAIL